MVWCPVHDRPEVIGVIFWHLLLLKKVTPAPELIGNFDSEACLHSENVKAVCVLPNEANVLLLLLRLQNPNRKCAKLHTVAANNNRVHPTRSLSSLPSGRKISCWPGAQALLEVTHQDHSIGITLLVLLRATYIWVLLFAHIPFVANRAFNATPTKRLQQSYFAVSQCGWVLS